jgi:hypothetical protein
VPDYARQIGRNTPYTIHPEEILAENFALLVRGETDVPSPEVLRRMEDVLRGDVAGGGEAPGRGE